MSRTLLVLDDSQTIQEAVRNALAGEDWEVLAVHTVDEAVEAVSSNRPDAVLCDVAPGEEDGYEACRRIRESAGGAGLPVILMGARVGEGPARSAGATAVLPKPFSSDELLHVLHEALETESFALALDSVELTGEPAGPVAAASDAEGSGEDEEQIEIIDLSDEDAFADLELLDDLEPIEPAPPPEAEGPTSSVSEPDTGAPIDLSEELDLGSIELALEEPAEQPVEPARTAPEPEPASPAEDQAAAHAEFSLEQVPVEDEGEDLPPATDEAVPGEPPQGADLGDALQPAQADEERSPEVEDLLAGLEPEVATPATEEAQGAEDAVHEQASEASEPESISEAGLRETPESYLEEVPGWTAPGPTPPHAGDWDQALGVAAEGEGLPQGELEQAVERSVRQALEQSLSPEVLTPLVQAAVERVVWEVVPQIAERMIQEAIERIQKEPPPPPA